MSEQQCRRFDIQFKHDALRLVQESNRNISDRARELGIRPELLYRWKSEFAVDPA
jgi:transposase-like protein